MGRGCALNAQMRLILCDRTGPHPIKRVGQRCALALGSKPPKIALSKLRGAPAVCVQDRFTYASLAKLRVFCYDCAGDNPCIHVLSTISPAGPTSLQANNKNAFAKASKVTCNVYAFMMCLLRFAKPFGLKLWRDCVP